MLVGWGSARSPFFTGLGVPSFAWLVLGMLAFELAAGLVLRAHPDPPVWDHIADLLVSFVVCFHGASVQAAWGWTFRQVRPTRTSPGLARQSARAG
jgi:hypothetical protein